MRPGSAPVHDCGVTARPCPRTGCRYFIAPRDEIRTGPVRKLPLVVDTSDTCALDVAERGGESLARIGRRLGVTREMARQILVSARWKLRPYLERIGARG